MGISTPEILTAEHNINDFYCQHETLNEWLSRRALKNNKLGASRTFVICKEGTKDVIGYYCLSAGSINHIESTPSLKRNMPDPIPVVLLGHLAVDVEYQGEEARGIASPRCLEACRQHGRTSGHFSYNRPRT